MDFAIVSNPEFLREGSAVKDFFYPPYTVIASEDVKALEKIEELTLYSIEQNKQIYKLQEEN